MSGLSRLALWRDAIGIAELSLPAKAVGWALSTFMNRHGVCWPSIAVIAGRAGCSRRAAVAAVAELEHAGLLTVERGYGRSTSRYVADVQEVHVSDLLDVQEVHVRRAGNVARRAGDARRRAPGAPKSLESLEHDVASLDATTSCPECEIGGGRHVADCPRAVTA